VQALKGAKQLFSVSHAEAGTIVPHKVDRDSIGSSHANLNLSVCAPARKLPRIADEILEHDLKHSRVSVDHHPGVNWQANLPFGVRTTDGDRNFLSQLCQVHRTEPEIRPANPRQLQQVVNQRGHSLGCRSDSFEVVLALIV
jgi:hypothetical protein